MSKPVIDATGREVPPPEPSSDMATLERLLMFLRANNYAIGPTPIRVGTIMVQVSDLNQSKGSELEDLMNQTPWKAADYHGP